MKSIPVGTPASAGFCASCPAPLERTGASTPTLAAALANRSRMVRSSGVGGIALKRSMEVSSPRASDTRFTASRKSAITASMRDCSAARTSIVKTHSLEAGTDIEERLDRLDGADDSERTVESTALGHRVDVRADEHDRIAVTLAGETREQISGRVATHLRAARGAPRGDQIARGLFLRGEPEPGNRAVARTDRGELVDTFLEPEEVAHVMRCASSSSGANGRPENTSASSAFATGSARSICAAKEGCRSAVPRARTATDSTRRPPRRSATYTILSASVAGAVAGSSTV